MYPNSPQPKVPSLCDIGPTGVGFGVQWTFTCDNVNSYFIFTEFLANKFNKLGNDEIIPVCSFACLFPLVVYHEVHASESSPLWSLDARHGTNHNCVDIGSDCWFPHAGDSNWWPLVAYTKVSRCTSWRLSWIWNWSVALLRRKCDSINDSFVERTSYRLWPNQRILRTSTLLLTLSQMNPVAKKIIPKFWESNRSLTIFDG